ncbi:MAG: CelD-like protein [Sphingobium sp.]|nr:MAG: CelD-like protein [Sphingobium sp.]
MTLIAGFAPLPPLQVLGPRWRALEARAAPNVFLGWTWMESWLAATGAQPELLTVQDGDRDVALALVGRATDRRLLGHVQTLWLNQSGVPAQDRPFIEHNGLLTVTDASPDIARIVLAALLDRTDWRALRLSGVAPDAPLLRAAGQSGRFRRHIRIDASPAHHVDLTAVRAAAGDYLSLLSANSRNQIRRAEKEEGGAPAVSTAGADDIAPWLADMATLNAGRHADNAWDEPLFRAFAAALVRAGIASGEVELLRFDADDGRIGYLLNLISGNRAMNYQSAFIAPRAAKAKPGLVCHAAAVGHYAARGLDLYSLLAGKDRYKQSLSTGAETLEWWTLERFSPRLEAEALLRRVLRRPAG